MRQRPASNQAPPQLEFMNLSFNGITDTIDKTISLANLRAWPHTTPNSSNHKSILDNTCIREA